MMRGLWQIAALLGGGALAAGGGAAWPGAGASQAVPQVFLIDARDLLNARQALEARDERLAKPRDRLIQDATRALRHAPVSVMEKTPLPPSGDRHDYMSLAPYWWPNPATATGLPYVVHDGETNPECKSIPDEAHLAHTISDARVLTLASFFTGNSAYAEHAGHLLRVFFLDPATRMNPNLTYAQIVRGRSGPNPTGIIDSRDLALVVDGGGLLAGSPQWTASDRNGMRVWFVQYLDWLLTSESGRREGQTANNHRSFYDQQAVAIALFLGRTDVAREKLQDAKDNVIAKQIEPDGSQPLELRRTRSWHYSVFNLEALLRLVALSRYAGADLGGFTTADGRSVRKALDYLIPYALGDKPWPYPEMGTWDPKPIAPLLLQASAEFKNPGYRDAARRVAGPAAEADWVNLLYP